jgi:hypothetical protein
MSLPIFDALINKFPDEQTAIMRLAELVGGERSRQMTFDHLVVKLAPNSVENLAVILAELTKLGLVRRFIRLESPRGGGVEDYSSLEDVPERIHDWRTDEDIEVTPQNLRVFYMLK